MPIGIPLNKQLSILIVLIVFVVLVAFAVLIVAVVAILLIAVFLVVLVIDHFFHLLALVFKDSFPHRKIDYSAKKLKKKAQKKRAEIHPLAVGAGDRT